MDLTELNIFPKFVPCKNSTCEAMFSTSIETALAILEYMNYEKPNSTFKFNCGLCHNENVYTLTELLKLLPINKRPRNLPINEVLVLILVPIRTEKPMDNPAFGELVRAKIIERKDDIFFCKPLEKSLLSPTLTDNEILYCRVISGYIFAFDRLVKDNVGQRWEPIQKVAPPKGSVFGLFFVKEDSMKNDLIMPANPKCSNPSCNYFFSFTAKRLHEMLESTTDPGFQFDKKYLTIECPICSTNRIITEPFLNTLYPV